MKELKKIIFIVPFVLGLILVRMYENTWFYDPFLVYFKGSYKENPFPDFNGIQLFFNLGFRYVLNTVLSLGIIFILFKNKEFIKIASLLYLMFFVILISGFFYIVNYTDSGYNFALFYIRRFLIQPLLLLLFLPAFYLQLKSQTK